MKINTKVLLALAFLAAAANSPIVTAMFAFAIIFICKDAVRAGLAIKAVVLAMLKSIVAYALTAVTTIASIVGISAISSVLSIAVSICNGIVGLAVIVVALVAARNVMDESDVALPIVDIVHKGFDDICE